MIKGSYRTNSLADNVTSTDLNLQLEGFYEAEIRYNTEKRSGRFHRRRRLYRRRWRGLLLQRERHGWPRAVDSNL